MTYHEATLRRKLKTLRALALRNQLELNQIERYMASDVSTRLRVGFCVVSDAVTDVVTKCDSVLGGS